MPRFSNTENDTVTGVNAPAAIEDMAPGSMVDAAETANDGDMGTLSELVTAKLNAIRADEDKVLPEWRKKKFVSAAFSPILNSENDSVNCKIAVVAPVSAGKSTLLNSICEYPILPAASGITSSVPTYITRAAARDSESILVYPLKKKVTTINGTSTTNFVWDEQRKKTFKAPDISEPLFNELFEYVFYIMRGNGQEYATTIENIAYFMKSTEAVDIEFNGKSTQKMSLEKDDFALTYSDPRHRLLLLMVLLCLYVGQNEEEGSISQYKEQINGKRKKLLQKCGLPANEDYCVCLSWHSASIPAGVTLIDLPGTGADTKDRDTQSSHTALVKGMLYDADAIWVLASAAGVVESDLLYAIKDAIETDTKKNRVCIYNCKNSNPNDETPVRDFITKLPFLAGERCYVVNALAGEFKYTQNGINATHTKTASNIRKNPLTRRVVVDPELLWDNYGDIEIGACPTYITHKEEGKPVAVTQEEDSYTLETFFKRALTAYVSRLKYEVSLRNAIKQADFFGRIKNDLESTLKLLESIGGKGPEIKGAVTVALEKTYKEAIDKYVENMVRFQTELNTSLDKLAEEIGTEVNTAFGTNYATLITVIHAEWRKLITDGTDYTMTKNIFGNYPLGAGHENWIKFCSVLNNVDSMISINAFALATGEADKGIQKYRNKLLTYISSLKNTTNDFRNDYIKAFSVEYDKQRDRVCCDEKGETINDQLFQNFKATKDNLMDAIRGKMDGLYQELCSSFDDLLAPDGHFETLVADTNKEFKKFLSDKVLDGLRADLHEKLKETNRIRLFSDRLDVAKFNTILLSDFTHEQGKCKKELGRIVNGIYGKNLGLDRGTLNFLVELLHTVNSFNADVIAGPSGANIKIKNIHDNIIDLVGFGAGMATNVTQVIADVKEAISHWKQIGEGFFVIKKYLVNTGTENVLMLCESYRAGLTDLTTYVGNNVDAKQ